MIESLDPSGVIPIVPVLFKEDESVDFDAFGQMIRWICTQDIDALALFGLASEYWKLSECEQRQLAERLVTETGGRFPVFLSVTATCAYHAERQAKEFQTIGATGLIVMPPHFMSPSPASIIDHCRRVADSVDAMPVIVQYSPAYVGGGLQPEAFFQMHQANPNIAYAKVEPRPPGPMVDAIHAATSGAVRCFIGQGGLSLDDCCRRGIAGVMPGAALVDIYAKLWKGLARGALSEEMWQIHDRLMTLISHMAPTIDTWVAADKQLLAWRGIIDRPVMRHPGSKPDEGFYACLRQCFDRLQGDLGR